MSFLRRLGFERGDERGEAIGLRSCRISWTLTTVGLAGWSLYSFVDTGTFLSAPLILFLSSQIVYWISFVYYSSEMGS